MSRNVDMTKPLKNQSADDLRYALDRGLITDPADRQKVAAFLSKESDEDPEAEEPSEDPNADVTFDPKDHNVDDVVAHAESDEVSAEEVQAIIEMEQAGKNRSSLLEKLEAMLVPDEPDSED